jgi:hypothetical protein
VAKAAHLSRPQNQYAPPEQDYEHDGDDIMWSISPLPHFPRTPDIYLSKHNFDTPAKYGYFPHLLL